MINYQPLNLVNEWKLFIYNVKFIWKSLRRPWLGQRINSDTYRFLLVLSWLVVPSCIIFLMPFRYWGIVTSEENAYYIFSVHIVVRIFFHFFLLGRKLQDWGIPQCVVLLPIIGCIWGTYELGYPLTFDVNHPFIKPSSTKETILNVPQYMEWMSCFTVAGIFIPDNKNMNRFGKTPEKEIILLGRRFNALKTVIRIEPLEFIRSGLLFLKKSMNFRGRSSTEELGSFGGFVIAIQWFVSAMWYGGQFADPNRFVTICELVHILLFIRKR